MNAGAFTNGQASEVIARHFFGCEEASLAARPTEIRGVTVVICTYRRSASLRRFLESLALQIRMADLILIVDASETDETDQMIRKWVEEDPGGRRLAYFRVTGTLKGLTRQRNFGLRWVGTDLVAFFDDDIVLKPGCLGELEGIFRSRGDGVVGAVPWIENDPKAPGRLWKLRRALGMVSHLRPGSYHRSGISIEWSIGQDQETIADGEWIFGGATMWRTSVPRRLGFHEAFGGYAQGEDLEFSLRARKSGRLVCNPRARALHLHEPGGRPDHFRLGYMAIWNRYEIHRRCLDNRTWRDVLWFIYAWTVDSILMGRYLVRPRLFVPTLQQWAGRVRAAWDLVVAAKRHWMPGVLARQERISRGQA